MGWCYSKSADAYTHGPRRQQHDVFGAYLQHASHGARNKRIRGVYTSQPYCLTMLPRHRDSQTP